LSTFHVGGDLIENDSCWVNKNNSKVLVAFSLLWDSSKANWRPMRAREIHWWNLPMSGFPKWDVFRAQIAQNGLCRLNLICSRGEDPMNRLKSIWGSKLTFRWQLGPQTARQLGQVTFICQIYSIQANKTLWEVTHCKAVYIAGK
jgi:hypothetical protein